MPSKRKRNDKEKGERPTIHPRNKYSENPPDFAHLASLYPSFSSFIFYSRDGRPRIDWTDFNATRELTRVLLLHDHALNWWIPEGQLCPTVPNRSNYIHWLEDLISSDVIVNASSKGDTVRGFDIGTGANCIYPLLGASLLGWRFVGTDVTDVALEWAQKNVNSNPHVAELIEIREVETNESVQPSSWDCHNGDTGAGGIGLSPSTKGNVDEMPSTSVPKDLPEHKNECYFGPPILFGVVRDGEQFDFCMCNPPFFESIEEAGLNPKTSCGGTPQEMVCPGGEKAFITRMIQDSVRLKSSFRWFTSMVGRKSNLKPLMSKLRNVGVTIIKTTEFVQGQTCRWGLAWSFSQPVRKISSTSGPDRDKMSFMLEGIQRQHSAFHVLQAVESFFCIGGASCKLNTSSFGVDVYATKDHCVTILENALEDSGKCTSSKTISEASSIPSGTPSLVTNLFFRISVFQQNPGTLLVKGSVQDRDQALSGAFPSVFRKLEQDLRQKFCNGKKSA